jgi:hypothetical protein
MNAATWSEPYRVACDKHNEFRPVFTNGRPLLDDTCPWCNCDALALKLEEAASHLRAVLDAAHGEILDVQGQQIQTLEALLLVHGPGRCVPATPV